MGFSDYMTIGGTISSSADTGGPYSVTVTATDSADCCRATHGNSRSREDAI
jgi:hypothetical protein